MKETPFKEIKLKLSDGLVETISDKEIFKVVESISEEDIFNMVIDNALSKAKHYLGKVEYYLSVSKCKETKERYGTQFISLKKKVKKVEKEVVEKADVLVVCGHA
jgi:serine/threonine protein phosphatase PrpC